MTYAQALSSGYKDSDRAYQRGYISRKTDIDAQPVLEAGGSRKGWKYVLIPCWNSTQYCIRQYIRKK